MHKLYLSVAAVAALLSAPASAEPKGTIVYSCDFDDMALADNVGTNGLPKGWREQEWADKKIVYGYEKGFGGKGAALKIDVRGLVGGALQVFSGPWEQWQGSWYRLTFKAKGFDHPGHVTVFPRRYFYPWSILGWPAVGFKPENEWKEYSCVKLAKHDIQRDFGVMIQTGDIGCFLIDDIKVERFAENPEKPKPKNVNPVVTGNLVAQGSFEGEQTSFFIIEGLRSSSDIAGVWNERWIERAEGGATGRHCLKLPRREFIGDDGKKRVSQGRLRGIPVPVAAGRRYRLSAYVKCDGAADNIAMGITSSLGGGGTVVFAKGRPKPPHHGKKPHKPGEWVFVTGLTKTVPDNVTSVTIDPVTSEAADCYIDGVDFHVVEDAAGDDEKYRPAAPYEFALSFRTESRWAPKIAVWGRKLPLRVGVWPSAAAPCGAKVPAVLRSSDYFGRVTEMKLDLVAGEEKDIDFDPKANGILRVELISLDPAAAKTLEKVYARLPESRKTGTESGFGTHMRICPGIIDYCAAIGIKWQRLHDCSNICKMKWANAKKGQYRWGDEQIDYLRAKGFNILALPDYPAEWIKKYSDGGVDTAGMKREKRVEYDVEAYAAWCEELARHYRGKINHIELWNEPYIRYFFGGTQEEFGKIWLAAARAVRRGNPDVKVVGFCTELCSPQFMIPALPLIPAADKPDIHSVHYYYNQIPGDGELSYGRLIGNIRGVFGDKFADSGEMWNTEGNMAGSNSFYSHRRISKEANDRAVTFGSRGWAETFAGGISKVFIYTMHNTDNVNVGGLMTLIDYDRSVNPKAAATATTAYFIDALKPVATKAPSGVKFCAFAGQGRTSLLVYDDILERCPKTFDIDAFAADPKNRAKGCRVYDAMGNEIGGNIKIGSMPVFVTGESEDAAALAAAVAGAIR